MKLEKFENWCKFASEGLTKYDFAIFICSYILMAMFKDLGLENAMKVSSSIFLLMCVWYVCTFVCLLVFAIIKRARLKKTNIEKLIDEEARKENK